MQLCCFQTWNVQQTCRINIIVVFWHLNCAWACAELHIWRREYLHYKFEHWVYHFFRNRHSCFFNLFACMIRDECCLVFTVVNNDMEMFHLTAYTTVFTGDFIVPRDLSILAWANRSISNTPWLTCESSHLFWEQIFVLRWGAKSEANIYSWLVKMSQVNSTDKEIFTEDR